MQVECAKCLQVSECVGWDGELICLECLGKDLDLRSLEILADEESEIREPGHERRERRERRDRKKGPKGYELN